MPPLFDRSCHKFLGPICLNYLPIFSWNLCVICIFCLLYLSAWNPQKLSYTWTNVWLNYQKHIFSKFLCLCHTLHVLFVKKVTNCRKYNDDVSNTTMKKHQFPESVFIVETQLLPFFVKDLETKEKSYIFPFLLEILQQNVTTHHQKLLSFHLSTSQL